MVGFTIKNKRKPRQAKTYKGGMRYRAMNYNRMNEQWEYNKGQVVNISDQRINEIFRTPCVFIDTLPNVSTHPNKDSKYKYYGLLLMYVANPHDVSTIKWTLEQYIQDNVLSVINDNDNPNLIKYTLDKIKINEFNITANFEAQSLNNVKTESKSMGGSALITGSIYVPNNVRINKEIEKNVYSKMPEDISILTKSFIKKSSPKSKNINNILSKK